MRIIFIFFCCFICFASLGCVASQDHTRRGDVIAAKNSEAIRDLWAAFEALPVEKPDYKQFQDLASRVNQAAQEHAAQDPRPPAWGIVQNAKNGYETSGIVGLALALVGSGVQMYRQKKKFKAVADDLEREPDLERCRALRKGVV